MTLRSRTAIRPLNPKAVAKANELQPTCNTYEEKKAWMDAYIAAGGKCESTAPKGKEVGAVVKPCPKPIKREAIPLVFVPGIMGSRLRLKTGTPAHGSEGVSSLLAGILPIIKGRVAKDKWKRGVRWDPGDPGFMLDMYKGIDPKTRYANLIGKGFSEDYLIVDNAEPVGNGFAGVSEESYGGFLRWLETVSLDPLNKLFDFPVYAFGYNWTDTNDHSGSNLAKRINEIIKECNLPDRPCEKVIVITHSMGGLVARSATLLHGADSNVLGIIHGVQPVTGAPAAYWRMKAGFELSSWWNPINRIASSVLGNNGPKVTALLANMPGGLELLPTKHYNDGKPWLHTSGDIKDLHLPRSGNPYKEIYSEKTKYWRLVDPELLKLKPKDSSGENEVNIDEKYEKKDENNWEQYKELLSRAEQFHDKIKIKRNVPTAPFSGKGHTTAAEIQYKIESNRIRTEDYYGIREFRGLFERNGNKMQAVLQDPAGDGDGTVPYSSGSKLDSKAEVPPGPLTIKCEHEPAYKPGTDWAPKVQEHVKKGISQFCQEKFNEAGVDGF